MTGPIALDADQNAALRKLVEAGADGVALGRDLSLSMARILEGFGFARVTDGRRFKALATGQGKTFLRRTAS